MYEDQQANEASGSTKNGCNPHHYIQIGETFVAGQIPRDPRAFCIQCGDVKEFGK